MGCVLSHAPSGSFSVKKERLREKPLSSSTALSLVEVITKRRLWELDRILADTDGIVDSKEKTVLLLRLKPLVRQIEKEARAKKNRIPYMSMDADSDNRPDRVVTEVCKVEFTSFAKFVLAIHDTISAVRQHQGIQEDPQRIRDSFNNLMVPLVEREKQHFRAIFPGSFRSSCEIAWVDFPKSAVEDEIKLFCRATDKLKEHLWEKTELDAAEVELKQTGQVVESEQEPLRDRVEAQEKALLVSAENRLVAQHDEKEGTRTNAEMRSTCRAETVGKIIKELNILKPQMFGEQGYDELKTKHPGFLTFGIADQREDLKLKLVNLQEHRQHIRLAQELAASFHGKQLSTIEKDWKRYKPSEFRKKKG